MKPFFTTFRVLVDRYAQRKVIFPLLLLMSGVYLYMILVTIPAVTAYAGGLRLFDLRPWGYGLEEATALLTALGEAGRQAYLTRQIPFDMVYPALFAATGSLLLAYVLRRGFPASGRRYAWSLVPIAAGVCDYGENIGVIGMLLSFPDLSPALVAVSAVFSVAKALLTTVFFLAFVVGVVAMGARLGSGRTTGRG